MEKQLAVLPTRDVASQSWSANGIVYVAENAERQCDVERMLAHGITACARVERYNNERSS